MKKRGFGEGKYNGAGGKVEEGEDIAVAAAREAQEEIGVVVELSDMRKHGVLQFKFEQKSEWNVECHVFATEVWQGEPTESDEMAPRWFSYDAVPYAQMWVDDVHWLPHLLAGKSFEGEFRFTSDGSRILKQSVRLLE